MGIIDYKSPLSVLISVKGHPYERDPFAEVFDSFEGIRHTFVEQPASQAFLNPEPSPGTHWCFTTCRGSTSARSPPGLLRRRKISRPGLENCCLQAKAWSFSITPSQAGLSGLSMERLSAAAFFTRPPSAAARRYWTQVIDTTLLTPSASQIRHTQ